MCVGFCELLIRSVSEGSVDCVDVSVSASAMATALQRLFAEAEISARRSLRTLRVYYLSELFDVQLLRAALASHLAAVLGMEVAFPVIFVATTALRRGCVLTSQFTAVDLVQLQGETWIHNGRS